jgi:hypothetical protein
MHGQQSYDTSSQAMTEVALGLSMAFFALLILALLSFQMPSPKQALKPNKTASNELSEQVQIKSANATAQNNTVASDTQFIFFYQGGFINQQLQTLQLSTLQTTAPVVLAVEKSLSFAEVINIRQKINHPSLSITLITKEWQNVLEQRP